MKKSQKTPVWQFYTEGGKNHPHCVLGTMHVAHEAAFAFENAMKTAIDACTIFASEFDLDATDPQVLQRAMLLPDALVLTDVLGQKLYDKTDKILQKMMGQSVRSYLHFKPILFSRLFAEAALPSERHLPLDEMLMQYAREQGKILRGCETFAEQVAVLHKIPLAAQTQQLKGMVAHFSKVRQEFVKTADWYAKGEIDKLHKSAKRSVKGTKKLMLTDRNALMVDRIEAMTAEGRVCAAVGAGHLWGNEGILAGLRRRGFVVKPL